MSARFFLDTNVLVYAFHADDPDKQRQAREILSGEAWMISWQVVQEFSSVALHRFAVPLRVEDLREYAALRLWPRCRVYPSEAVYAQALAIHERWGYRFYDSLIVAGAWVGGAEILYSEDLQDGQRIGPLRVQNPFAH